MEKSKLIARIKTNLKSFLNEIQLSELDAHQAYVLVLLSQLLQTLHFFRSLLLVHLSPDAGPDVDPSSASSEKTRKPRVSGKKKKEISKADEKNSSDRQFIDHGDDDEKE